jgi:hypothetical protein
MLPGQNIWERASMDTPEPGAIEKSPASPVEDKTRHGADDRLLHSMQTRARYGGRSDMWLRRQVEAGLLPKPIYIGTTRYWRLSELLACEQAAPRDWAEAERRANQRRAEQPDAEPA